MPIEIRECVNCRNFYEYFKQKNYKKKSKIYCIDCFSKPHKKQKQGKIIMKKQLVKKDIKWKPKLTMNFRKNSKTQS